MQTLRDNWSLICIVVSIASCLASGIWAVHDHLEQDRNRDEAIRVLKTIAVQEHPAYWPMLFPGVKP